LHTTTANPATTYLGFSIAWLAAASVVQTAAMVNIDHRTAVSPYTLPQVPLVAKEVGKIGLC
jgi:hypothetical protein